MDDEFKLCWKNFQDNIASGFQNLYDRGDLVDVTLACDGKVLHAHKIVLAICSPYFQEIFITNPCKHPIIILKDVTFNIMCELLEFMYQGVVNVKHTELQSFMKVGQMLQIKGLATNSASSAASTVSEKSSSQAPNSEETPNTAGDVAASISNTKSRTDEVSNAENSNSGRITNAVGSAANRSNSPVSTSSPMELGSSLNQQQNFKSSIDGYVPLHSPYYAGSGVKRLMDFGSDVLSIYSRKQARRSVSKMEHSSEHNDASETGMDQVNPEDFLSTIPHISMVESRYELNNLKREGDHHTSATGGSPSLRNSFGPAFGFDYNLYKNSSAPSGATAEYPNELHMPNDYSKNFGNHMDIPAIAPGEHWFQGKLEFMLSQRGKPLLVHDGHTFGIQYVRKDKKYWQCNLSRKFNCKARVTTTDTGEIIVTNNEHCHTEIRQHLRKDYQRNKVMVNALLNLTTNRLESLRRQNASSLSSLQAMVSHSGASLSAQHFTQLPIGGGVGVGESSLLDLGKPLSSHSDEVKTKISHVDDDDDDEQPLDCGMRPAVTEGGPNKTNHNANNDNSNCESDWKTPNEPPNTQ